MRKSRVNHSVRLKSAAILLPVLSVCFQRSFLSTQTIIMAVHVEFVTRNSDLLSLEKSVKNKFKLIFLIYW